MRAGAGSEERMTDDDIKLLRERAVVAESKLADLESYTPEQRRQMFFMAEKFNPCGHPELLTVDAPFDCYLCFVERCENYKTDRAAADARVVKRLWERAIKAEQRAEAAERERAGWEEESTRWVLECEKQSATAADFFAILVQIENAIIHQGWHYLGTLITADLQFLRLYGTPPKTKEELNVSN